MLCNQILLLLLLNRNRLLHLLTIYKLNSLYSVKMQEKNFSISIKVNNYVQIFTCDTSMCIVSYRKLIYCRILDNDSLISLSRDSSLFDYLISISISNPSSHKYVFENGNNTLTAILEIVQCWLLIVKQNVSKGKFYFQFSFCFKICEFLVYIKQKRFLIHTNRIWKNRNLESNTPSKILLWTSTTEFLNIL